MTGHHLQMAGADVTFLVRPARAENLSRPQVLYSYDDATLRHFTGYRVLSDVTEVAERVYDYVIVTLDGASALSPEGTTLLNRLGDAVRATSATVVIGGVGFRLREHFLRALGLPQERVINGALALLAHPLTATRLSVHPPTDAALLGRADLAYRHLAGTGFVVEDRFPAVAARFKALYDASGVSVCDIVDHERHPAQVVTLFPAFAAGELMGWPPAARYADREDLLDLAVHAAQEAASVDEYGPAGQAVAAQLSGESIIQMLTAYEEQSQPLDWNEFIAFHHGGKVAQQDLKLLQDHITAGERQDLPMTALRKLTATLTSFRQR